MQPAAADGSGGALPSTGGGGVDGEAFRVSTRKVAVTAGKWLHHYLPFTRWLPRYPWRRDLYSDLVAAGAEVVIATPEAIAYASIAGLRAQNGLYAAMIGPM
jgi:hypothetical protein